MRKTRYTTDGRLWLWIAIALFVASWFLPVIGSKGGWVRPVVLLWELAESVAGAGISDADTWGIGAVLTLFFCGSMLTAFIVAWLIQCAVVIVRTKKGDRN